MGRLVLCGRRGVFTVLTKPNFIQEYFDKPTHIMAEDGHYLTRIEIIRSMEKSGYDKKDIDWYLFCMDQRLEKL